MPATRLNKWTEKRGLGDQISPGEEEGRSSVRTWGCKPNWVNSPYWLVIGEIFPLF